MATSALDMPDRSVSIGRIFSRAFATLGSNPAATFGVAFLFGALPALIINYISREVRQGVVQASLTVSVAYFAITMIVAILSLVFYFVTQGALVRATIAESESRQASFAECASAGLSMAVPLFGLGFLTGVAFFFGLLILVVPGIILLIMWSVAAPALVAERRGVFESLGRSRYLTKGARLKIFGLELLLMMCVWAFSALVFFFFGGTEGLLRASQQGFSLGYLVVNAVVQTLFVAVWGTIQTSIYIDLRDWKDGPAVDALADVFA